jgi:hypothetical protein
MFALCAAAAHGSSPRTLVPDTIAASVAPDGQLVGTRIIWQYWGQGPKHLQSLAVRANESWEKYSMGSRCAEYWKRLNPGYEHRLLNESAALALSPAFAALENRSLDFALKSDILRLDLLSRFGGVWADVTTCPVQPLDNYASQKAAKVGFFGLMWEPFYKLVTRGNHTPGSLEGFDKDGPCVGRQKMTPPRVDTQGYHTIDTWFLVSPQPHHPIVDAWLHALVTAVEGLPEGATSCRPKHCAVKGDYVYHLVMCVLGQVYTDNPAVRTLIDAMPAESLCQHGGNASPRCERVLETSDEQAVYDQRPDPNKWMYKSFSSEKIAYRDYEAWVTRASAANNNNNNNNRLSRRP